jgi:excisionase family DNA binding protein
VEATPPQVHTLTEAAAILRVRVSWLERRAAAREIPFSMLGGAYRFTTEHLAEIIYLNEQRPAAAKESKPTSRRKQTRKAASDNVTLLRSRPRPEGPRRKNPAA